MHKKKPRASRKSHRTSCGRLLKRQIALLLCLCLFISMGGEIAYAKNSQEETKQESEIGEDVPNTLEDAQNTKDTQEKKDPESAATQSKDSDAAGGNERKQSKSPTVKAFSGSTEIPADGIVTADTKEDILSILAANGIYPVEKATNPGKNEWTVYDAEEQSDDGGANIKATVTFSGNIDIPENNCLYIRKVEPGEDHYPTDDALKIAGRINEDANGEKAVQCYTIHWVKIFEEDGAWKADVRPESVLGDTEAAVKIEYLKEDAYLAGRAANRKLQVYNSTNTGTELVEASTLTDVTANANAYTGFIFKTSRGGPYVFVSKYLYDGYVRSLTVNKDGTTDGSAPFDEDDKPGNDSSSSNGIVRSYDNLQYSLTANFGARSNTSTEREAKMYFEMTMEADITEAAFDTGQMLWLGSDYSIEYLDKDDNVVLVRTADGKYHKGSKDGAVLSSLNDIVSDSNQGESSYTTDICRQRLQGYMELKAEQNILASNHTFSTAIQVLGAKNGDEIQPVFKAWLDGNEDNYGSENPGEGSGVSLAEPVLENEIEAEPVTVSAAARFNLELAKNNNISYKGWFDSSRGNEVQKAGNYTVGEKTVSGEALYELLEGLANLEENKDKSDPAQFTDGGNACSALLGGADLSDYKEAFGNIRYGRITGYGVTLQVRNNASSDDNTGSKGFRGVSLPQGEVGFDLALTTMVKEAGEGSQSREDSEYYAKLWEYNENVNSERGNQGKNMYWAYLASTRYAAWAAPYNTGANASACYEGGTWELEGGSGNHFTVNGYDLNFLFSGLEFPTHRAGNSSATDGYNSYIGSYSAEYVQVLNVFPRNQTKTLNMETDVTVKNLTVETTDGTKLSPDSSDTTGYAHETDNKDNSLKDSIPLYAKGGMTKANAFCTAAFFDNQGTANFSSGNYYLGTDFWGTSYDCSAFAGQEITLVGAARINAGDYTIKHMNMLQLFDSEVLSLTEGKTPYVVSQVEGTEKGDTTILYAADPNYKNGYDTNDKKVMHYMSTVREEDLIYYESLEELEKNGYVCVGVMAELRNWTIYGEGGYGTVLKIPMNVTEEEDALGITVGTVNAVRIWTNANDMENGTVSWADGTYDFTEKKNSVEGYTPVNSNDSEHYSGQVANGGPYEKTEYEGGQVKLGSNTGGYVYGSSLLILGYKSKVDIEVDNGGNGSLPTYDMDKGNYTVNYRMTGIIAQVDTEAGKAQETKTNLTVLAKLDTKEKKPTEWEETEKQRMEVASGTYRMKPASDQMVLTDENGNALSEQLMEISADPSNPTTIHYAFIDEGTGEVDKDKIYTIQVYAQRATNGREITFEISSATVNVSVPDITYDALIASDAVKNNDRIQATACISGTSDIRAYSDTNGNMDMATIGIIKLTSTRLVKSVDKRYIELDEVYTYTVRYTNSGQSNVDLYLYDLMPNTNDIRDSNFDGSVLLRDVAANLTAASGGNTSFTADIQFYYSKVPYRTLYDKVKLFGGNEDGTGKSTENVEKLLKEEEWTNPDTQKTEKWFYPLGSINSSNNHEFQTSDYLKDTFKGNSEGLTEEMAKITGVYALVKDLSGGKSLSIDLTVETKGNKAGDLYCNIANSWLGQNDEPLTSNKVTTQVVSRTINGNVWHDANLNGKRDESKEELISDVTCSLFKKNESGKYEPVKGSDGPNSRNVASLYWDAGANDGAGGYVSKEFDADAPVQMTTGSDGFYGFTHLTEGEYIVVFSGEMLANYTGATTYRVNGQNDNETNDGVALQETVGGMDTEYLKDIAGINGDTYSYAIAYNLSGENEALTIDPASLHSINDIEEKDILLTNGVELYGNLDLGLVHAGYELPETGGAGTLPYRVAGILLSAIGAFGIYFYKRKRRL